MTIVKALTCPKQNKVTTWEREWVQISSWIVNPHSPMIKDDWFLIVVLVLSCHQRISDIDILYFPFNITLSSECNLTASRLVLNELQIMSSNNSKKI